ncbi:hypothetical protein [Kaistella haifensis]|nr:hypothetical protein [Kaistella haifensis]
MEYQEYLNLVEDSKTLVDIKPSYQNGLSFRIFEALGYEKKIITNNSYVKEFNFYNPDNIFVTDFENFTGLNEFLEKPYSPIDEKIVYEYSLENWLHKLFSDI